MNASRQTKVKAAFAASSVLIAMHSPAGVVETGLGICPPEKRLESWREELRTRFSPVRFERKNCGIAAISRDFQDNAGRFLCTSDLLVALPGIEPGFED